MVNYKVKFIEERFTHTMAASKSNKLSTDMFINI